MGLDTLYTKNMKGEKMILDHPKNTATKIALSVHGRQKDKRGEPYMGHIEDVEFRVRQLGPTFSVVAILHDSIEDAKSKRVRKKIRNEIRGLFGEIVYDAVMAISKRPDEDYFKDYLVRVASNPIALQVKLADIKANLQHLPMMEDLATRERLRQKYHIAMRALGNKMLEQQLAAAS